MRGYTKHALCGFDSNDLVRETSWFIDKRECSQQKLKSQEFERELELYGFSKINYIADYNI